MGTLLQRNWHNRFNEYANGFDEQANPYNECFPPVNESAFGFDEYIPPVVDPNRRINEAKYRTR